MLRTSGFYMRPTHLRPLYKLLRFDWWVQRSTHVVASQGRHHMLISLSIKLATYQSRVACFFLSVSPCPLGMGGGFTFHLGSSQNCKPALKSGEAFFTLIFYFPTLFPLVFTLRIGKKVEDFLLSLRISV